MTDNDLIRRRDALAAVHDADSRELAQHGESRIADRIAALPAVTVWAYCPECGCEEPRFGEGPHKQCARCYQEWFTDIDYSEVVRCNLQKLFIAAFAVTPKVKPLVWKETYEKVPKSAWASHTGFGRWFIVLEFLGMNHAVYRLHEVDYPTLDAAKAAAQADYEARIMAALEPVVAPRRYMGQIMAECDCSRQGECEAAQKCLAVAAPDLTDPVTVHTNMLRGTIAKPTLGQIIHLYGVDALTKALAPVIVKEAAPYMTDLMVDPEAIPDMEMEYDHRAGASDDE